MNLKHNGKLVEIDAKRVSFLGKFSGLMFRTKNTQNLLFEFSRPGFAAIHSFFVFFPFVAVWLDKNNKVNQIDLVRPFTVSVSPKKPSTKLVEIPINKKNKKVLELLVGKGKI